MGIHDMRGFGEISDGSSNTMIIGESAYRQTFGAVLQGGRFAGGPSDDPRAPNANAGIGHAPWHFGAGAAFGSMSLAALRQRPVNPPRSALTLNEPINNGAFDENGDRLGRSQDTHNIPFSSRHPGGSIFVFADGHVIQVNENADLLTLQEAGSMNNGGVVDLDSL